MSAAGPKRVSGPLLGSVDRICDFGDRVHRNRFIIPKPTDSTVEPSQRAGPSSAPVCRSVPIPPGLGTPRAIWPVPSPAERRSSITRGTIQWPGCRPGCAEQRAVFGFFRIFSLRRAGKGETNGRSGQKFGARRNKTINPEKKFRADLPRGGGGANNRSERTPKACLPDSSIS
jgi:hypothetical protein